MAWLMLHRFRVAWLESRIEDKGLDLAIEERRAEGDELVATGARRHDPCRLHRSRLARDPRNHRRVRHHLGAARATPQPPGPTRGATMELTPRPVPTATAPNRRRRGKLAYVAVAVVLVALGFVLLRGLGDATLFFYNADEAVERRDELGDSRFRLQGTVEADSVESTDAGVTFVVTFAGAEVPVEHRAIHPSCSRRTSRWCSRGAGTARPTRSDRILVKHSESHGGEPGPARRRRRGRQWRRVGAVNAASAPPVWRWGSRRPSSAWSRWAWDCAVVETPCSTGSHLRPHGPGRCGARGDRHGAGADHP